ncbi:enamelin [Ctenodactylus gundi]
MFEQDFEPPKEKDPPKTESPPTEPLANSTVTETNSTQSNLGGSQTRNDTNPIRNPVPGPNTGSGPTAQNRLFPPPKVNTSGQAVPRNQIPWKPSQPNIYGIYPKPNIKNFPSGRQPTGSTIGQRQYGLSNRNQQIQRGPRRNSFAGEGKQAPRSRNPNYRKTYPPTTGANYPNHAGNPANFRKKPPGPNKPLMGTSVPPLNPQQGTIGHNAKVQNPKEKSLGQKEQIISPTKDTAGPWRNSQYYGVNQPNIRLSHQEKNMPAPNFNSVNWHDSYYYQRGESRRVPSSGAQAQSQNFPKETALEPKRIPYESETKPPELKLTTHQPIYTEKIPSPTREYFPAGRNSWNHQEIPPPFKEDTEKQEEHLPHPSHGSTGSVFYHEYSPYYPREHLPYIRSNTWGDRVASPNTVGQPENPQHPLNKPYTPDQKETIHYKKDPTDPTGDESFLGQSKWGEEELNFNRRSTVRLYEGEQFGSNQPKEYLPYSLDNPLKPREDFLYSELYPWDPDETFPSYSPNPTLSPPVESRGYYVNNAIGQEESPLFPSWNSWDHTIRAQGQKEREPYFNKIFWDQAKNLDKATLLGQKDNNPYSSNSPAGIQENPTWHEGENLNYDMQMNRLNSPKKEHLAFPDLTPHNYPSSLKEEHLFHHSQRGSCCAGGPTEPNNPLALQDYTPSYDHAPGKNQNINPTYTESSHTKHARPIISPTSLLPGHRNSSEKKVPGESQNPSLFRDLGQMEIMSFPEDDSPQSRNIPCFNNDLGVDENNVLEQIFEGNQLNKRTVGLIPEQLITGSLNEGPESEHIQNEAQGNEGERQQQRPPRILQIPCFGSNLAKLHFSGTRNPSSNRRRGPFDRDLTVPTKNPNILVGLATGEPFRNINVDQLNADEHTPFESFQRGIDVQDQVQDCLLLQA